MLWKPSHWAAVQGWLVTWGSMGGLIYWEVSKESHSAGMTDVVWMKRGQSSREMVGRMFQAEDSMVSRWVRGSLQLGSSLGTMARIEASTWTRVQIPTQSLTPVGPTFQSFHTPVRKTETLKLTDKVVVKTASYVKHGPWHGVGGFPSPCISKSVCQVKVPVLFASASWDRKDGLPRFW